MSLLFSDELSTSDESAGAQVSDPQYPMGFFKTFSNEKEKVDQFRSDQKWSRLDNLWSILKSSTVFKPLLG